MTATTLIYQALTEINKLESGQTTSPDVNADALAKLNQMLDSWKLDKFMVPNVVQSTYTLTAGQQSYQIGPAGPDFVGDRPTFIQDANLIFNTAYPPTRIALPVINVDVRSAIPVDLIAFAVPQCLYYVRNFDQTNGSSTIYLWPGPQTNYLLELWTWKQLTNFADLTTDYTFPPGWELCMRMNLAVEVYPMMRGRLKTQDPDMREVRRLARESKDALISYQAQVPVMATDAAFRAATGRQGGVFNWSDGMVGRGY